MVVNFRVRKINQGTRKLTRIFIIIIKKKTWFKFVGVVDA